VQFLSVITTYKRNEWGAETQAYLQANSVFTVSYLRYSNDTYFKTKYARYKLASDDAALKMSPGQKIMTPTLGKAEMINLMMEWVRRGLVEAPEDFKDRLVVERDADNPNRLNFIIQPDLVNQFKICGTVIKFLL
jgi:phage tail sheath gpL-like